MLRNGPEREAPIPVADPAPRGESGLTGLGGEAG